MNNNEMETVKAQIELLRPMLESTYAGHRQLRQEAYFQLFKLIRQLEQSNESLTTVDRLATVKERKPR